MIRAKAGPKLGHRRRERLDATGIDVLLPQGQFGVHKRQKAASPLWLTG